MIILKSITESILMHWHRVVVEYDGCLQVGISWCRNEREQIAVQGSNEVVTYSSPHVGVNCREHKGNWRTNRL